MYTPEKALELECLQNKINAHHEELKSRGEVSEDYILWHRVMTDIEYDIYEIEKEINSSFDEDRKIELRKNSSRLVALFKEQLKEKKS